MGWVGILLKVSQVCPNSTRLCLYRACAGVGCYVQDERYAAGAGSAGAASFKLAQCYENRVPSEALRRTSLCSIAKYRSS